MNILQVVLNLEYGGLEKLVISLSEELNKRGFCTSILCLDQKGALAKEAEGKGIRVLSLEKGPGLDLGISFRMLEIIKKEKIALVHTHNIGPLIYGTIAAKLGGIPSINTRHGRFDKKINRIIWDLNKRIVAVSQDAKETILKNVKIRPDKVKVIYNGISVNGRNNGTSEFGDRIVIGNVARLSEEKDHFTLIEAFSKVNKEIKDTVLVIVGDGPLKESVKRKAKSEKLEDKVLFLGMRDDAEELMGMFDLYVLSSTTEGISLTLLEAMAKARPIVATDVGGNREVVSDGETGILVPKERPDELAGAMIKILKDKELAKRMGGRGSEIVRERFSLDRMVKEYIELYEGANHN